MKKAATTYSVGIGGWEHETFDRCFYPSEQLDSSDKLSYYSRVFDTTEVRATFWDDTLNGEDAKRWIQAVRENRRFTFNVKLHSLFTHKKMIKAAATRNVRSLLHELLRSDRLGTLLIQLPYSFTNVSANRFHLEKLAEVFTGYPVRIEFRHDSWNQPSTWDFLYDHGLSSASTDLPRTKQLMPYTIGYPNNHGYVRLHGRNEKGWLLNGLDVRYDYLYNERELREVARRIEFLSRKCDHITIIFNNTTGGKAVANALQLASVLRDGKSVLIPESTMHAFPHLQEIAVVQKELTLIGNDSYRQAM